jgi:hypothetical protein
MVCQECHTRVTLCQCITTARVPRQVMNNEMYTAPVQGFKQAYISAFGRKRYV